MDGITFEERQHNTPEQVHGYLTEAEKILRIQGYDPHEDLPLLVAVLGLVAAKQIMTVQRPTVGVDLGALGLNGPRR